MTKRDYFAGQVLHAIAGRANKLKCPDTDPQKVEEWRRKLYRKIADYCYDLADAMVERSVR